MKINLITEIIKAIEPYKFPRSSVYPNICYVALTEEEIATSILTHLKEAYWPKSKPLKEMSAENLTPIIAKVLRYYANFPLYSDLVYVVRTEKEFCKVIAEALEKCFNVLGENLLLAELQSEMTYNDNITGSGVSECTGTSGVDGK